MRRWILILLLVVVVLPVAGFAFWAWAALKFPYSHGERAGYIQKISNKGWVCKTWEGELAMTTAPGVAPQIFSFSVRDESVARQISAATGQQVTLTYDQHRGIPTDCFGETEYFVTGVKVNAPKQ